MLSKLKIGYRAFCEETSIHGFIELYRAKYFVWKSLWFILLLAAVGITGFQLYGSIDQYVNKSPIKTVESATEYDIIYPPLKYCIPHWLLWLNKTDAKSMKDSTLIFALSYLGNISSEIWFNATEAKAHLKAYLKVKQYTLEKFFTQNARSIYSHSDREGWGEGIAFSYKELSYFDENIHMYYVWNQTYIKNEQSSSKRLTIRINQENQLDDLIGEHDTFFMTTYDLIKTVRTWCENRRFLNCWKFMTLSDESYDGNRSASEFYAFVVTFFPYRPPELLVIDGYNNKNIKLAHKGSEYSSQIKLTVQKLLPNDANHCSADVNTVFQNEVCNDKCSSLRYSSFYYHHNKSLVTPCKDLSTILLFGDKDYGIDDICGYPITGIDDYSPQQEKREGDNEAIFENCMKECNGGCNTWDWEIFSSVIVMGRDDKVPTVITIQYPTMNGVTILRESDTKTWQDFVGSVGGLLGIWTGASVLSLFQLVYLFCCPPELQNNDNVIKISTKNFKLPI